MYPGGVTRPLASNLNFGPWQDIPNLVIVKGGTAANVKTYNNSGGERYLRRRRLLRAIARFSPGETAIFRRSPSEGSQGKWAKGVRPTLRQYGGGMLRSAVCPRPAPSKWAITARNGDASDAYAGRREVPPRLRPIL